MEDIDLYYDSLKQVFEEMSAWRKPKPPFIKRFLTTCAGIFGVFLALSIIPIIPAILVYIGWPLSLFFARLNLTWGPFSRFILVWPTAVVIALIFVAVFASLANKVHYSERPEPPQTLSPEQITFLSAYEAYRELKIYFVSHIDHHVDLSLLALNRIIVPRRTRGQVVDIGDAVFRTHGPASKELSEPNETDVFYLSDREITYAEKRLQAGLPKQIRTARMFLHTFEKFAWFQLGSETKAILQALLSVQEKIPHRLRAREDLPAALSVLENFSKFTYAYLPEHKTYMAPNELSDLQADGKQCLRGFVDEINGLTSYQSSIDKKKKRLEAHKPRFNEKFRGYYDRSVFFRFTIWFVLILFLTSGAVILINQFVKLSADTMATVIIGTSVASAAALAGFLPLSKSE